MTWGFLSNASSIFENIANKRLAYFKGKKQQHTFFSTVPGVQTPTDGGKESLRFQTQQPLKKSNRFPFPLA